MIEINVTENAMDAMLDEMTCGQVSQSINRVAREEGLAQIYANKITLAPGLGLEVRGVEPRILRGAMLMFCCERCSIATHQITFWGNMNVCLDCYAVLKREQAEGKTGRC